MEMWRPSHLVGGENQSEICRAPNLSELDGDNKETSYKKPANKMFQSSALSL